MRELVGDIVRTLFAAVVAHQYVTLFLTIAVEEAGVPLPVPGDLLIAYFGSRATGDPIELAQVILVCALASTAGTQAPYWLARRFGQRITDGFTYWLDIDKKAVERLYERIDRHGFRDVLIGRLIPGLRVAVSVVAGTAGVPVTQFAGGVFVAALIYWTGWVLLGALVGPHVTDVLSPAYLRVIVLAIPVIVVALFAIRVFIAARRRSRQKRDAKAHPP
ncbi:MAG TPA: DedA family protein [Candidatus Limnocylindrales bacterium]|nr:DedA family protein [Candidatus Limnocylindrales bacterium]